MPGLYWACWDEGPCSRRQGDIPAGLRSSILPLTSALDSTFQLGIASNHPKQWFGSSRLACHRVPIRSEHRQPWVRHEHGQKEQSHELAGLLRGLFSPGHGLRPPLGDQAPAQPSLPTKQRHRECWTRGAVPNPPLLGSQAARALRNQLISNKLY